MLLLVGLRECEARSNPKLIQSEKEESSSKTHTGSTHAKRVKETVCDFEGNKQKHGETRSGAGVLSLVGLRECEARSNPQLIQSGKEESSTKTPGGPSHAKRVKGTRGDFEGNKEKHEETRSGAGVLLLVGLRECEARRDAKRLKGREDYFYRE